MTLIAYLQGGELHEETTVILSTEIGDLGNRRLSSSEEAKELLIKCTLAGKLTITKPENIL